VIHAKESRCSIEHLKQQVRELVANAGGVDPAKAHDEAYMCDVAGDSYATWWCLSELKSTFGLKFLPDFNPMMLTFQQIWDMLEARAKSPY
jgi:hypothetical protein